MKKFGFHQSEREHFAAVAENCGLLRRTADAACWARHPLAFLVEAADDICYRLIDFEDGFRLGHLSYEEVSAAFHAVIDPARHPRRLDDADADTRRVQILRDVAIGSAIEQCADLFLAQENEILAGTFDRPLIEMVPAHAAWQEIAQRSATSIYATPRGVQIEAAGFEVLGGLLEMFVSALNDIMACGRKGACARSNKLFQLLPAETQQEGEEPYLRLLRILDYVSGMTDSYAVALYKSLRGISLPGK